MENHATVTRILHITVVGGGGVKMGKKPNDDREAIEDGSMDFQSLLMESDRNSLRVHHSTSADPLLV